MKIARRFNGGKQTKKDHFLSAEGLRAAKRSAKTIRKDDYQAHASLRESMEHSAWVFMEVRLQGESWVVRVGDSAQSFYRGKEILGRPMDREEALKSPLLPEFFEVADFVVMNDPAINLFLRGESVDTRGREQSPG